MGSYEAVIGLEVHAWLRTRSKMFCRCPVEDEAPPNTVICPVCMGHPGTLPVVNREAVRQGVRAAIALGATPQSESRWARKHYFYPDLPKGYQVSQHTRPLATGGGLTVLVEGERREFGITRLHLEEDAGRMVHRPDGSLVDWNRAGVPLLEIVGEPDLTTAAEAEAWLRALHRVLVESGACMGDMEKGHFRCDANVSVRPVGGDRGTRVEVKNLNSFRYVHKALDYEIRRQAKLLRRGLAVEQETRTWTGSGTARLRTKEEAADYRYMPEPDLPALTLSPEEIADLRGTLPAAPLHDWLLDQDQARVQGLQDDHGLEPYVAGVLAAHPDLEGFFREAVAAGGDPRAMANWLQGDVQRRLKSDDLSLGESALRPHHLLALQQMVAEGAITLPVAREIFEEVFTRGGDPRELVASRGLGRMGDVGSLRPLVMELVESHPRELERYRNGNKKMHGFFMGLLMKATRGRADPRQASDLVRKVLEELAP